MDNISGSTTEERFRLYAGSREVAQIVRQNGVDKTLYFHTDNLGSPDTITTSDGEVHREEFDAFGAEVEPSSTELTRVGFTGHEHDRDLGLVDMKGRIYDPLASRFTTQDPVMQAPFWSQGLNRYAYTSNDPVNNTDPSGFQDIAADATGYIVDLDAGTAPGGFIIDLDTLPVPSAGAAAASPSASPGGGGGAAATAAGLVGTGVNIASKLLGPGYVGQHSTQGSQSSGATGKAAQTSKPSKASPSAASQNKGDIGPPPAQEVPNQAFAPKVGNKVLSDPEFKITDTSETWENLLAVVTAPGAPELGIAEGAANLLGRGAARLAARAAARSSRVLGRALEAAGHVRPPGAAAHHIVAAGAQRAAPARAVLERFGIGINDAANGAFLPSGVHAGIHTNAYYDAVNSALSQATTRQEALQVLDAIRRGLP